MKRCQELPGQELFQYIDEDGEVRDVASDDVNAYLREASGGGFTAKDFRTWAGTLLAFRALTSLGPADSTTASRKNVLHADPPGGRWPRQYADRRKGQLCAPGGR